jgi:hypothetical protein
VDHGSLAESREGAGADRALGWAREDRREGEVLESRAERAGVVFAAGREIDIGAPGVTAREAPLGLAVARDPDSG